MASDADKSFDSIETVLEALRAGRAVVMTDDANRENEGDLIFPAEIVDRERVNFMAMHGRGLICVALTPARLRALGLSRMAVRGKGDAFGTAFMESVDAARCITTGISAQDRAETIRVLADDAATGADLVSPGHTFPLEAVEGGVLRRAGHTEAAVDLARLAGFKPAGVICEILREDGHMARGEALRDFARRHHLPLATVSDLIAYRRRTERLVAVVREISLPTRHGVFKLKLYHSSLDNDDHLALVRGDVSGGEPPLVRVHSECLTGDVFHSLRCDCGNQIEDAMAMIDRAGRGVLLYMRQEGRGIGLANKLHAYALQEQGLDTVDANRELGFDADLRDYGIGAQILADLGMHRIRLMTNNPRKIVGLEGYGLEIVERVPLVSEPQEHNARYLATKKERLGHLL